MIARVLLSVALNVQYVDSLVILYMSFMLHGLIYVYEKSYYCPLN